MVIYSRHWRVLTLFFLMWLTPPAFAAQFTAAVNKTTVAKNEVFELVLTTDQQVSQDAIDFMPLKNNFFMGQPSFFQDKQYINGQWHSQVQWRIALAPTRLGYLIIPSFTINGVQSQPIKIKVTANPAEPKPEDLVKFETQLSQKILYPLQSAILTSKIIITADTRRLDRVRLSPPTAGKLALEPLDKAKQYSAIIDGLQATIIEQQYRLSPAEPGQYVISGAKFEAMFTFGDSLASSTGVLPLDIRSKPITLVVKPIPANAEQPWLPAQSLTLGQTWLPDATKQEASVTQGEAITREIHLAVSGIDPSVIPEVNVEYPTSVRVYREKPQIVSLPNGQSQITYKHTLIPSEPGQLSLPSISIPWWNANIDRNELATISGAKFKILPADTSLLPTMTPTATPSDEKIPSSQPATFWIGTTLLFALLWLITLTMLFKQKRLPKQIKTPTNSTELMDDLNRTLGTGDSIAILNAVHRWLNQYPADPDCAREIEAELTKMQQAHYGKDPQQWDGQVLLQLLKRCQKGRHTKQQDTLPPL